MKRVNLRFLVILVLFGLVGCDDVIINRKYQIDSIFSYSSYEEDMNKTEVSYRLDIVGTKDDIWNIGTSELIINPEYEKLVLIDNEDTLTIIVGQNDNTCLRVEGSIVFNTQNMNKEEISEMKLFDGIAIEDKDKKIHSYDLDE